MKMFSLSLLFLLLTSVKAQAAEFDFSVEYDGIITVGGAEVGTTFGTGFASLDTVTGVFEFSSDQTIDLTPIDMGAGVLGNIRFINGTFLPSVDNDTLDGLLQFDIRSTSSTALSCTSDHPTFCRDIGDPRVGRMFYWDSLSGDPIEFTESGAFITTVLRDGQSITTTNFEITTVPVPPAFALFASGLIGLFGLRRQRAKSD